MLRRDWTLSPDCRYGTTTMNDQPIPPLEPGVTQPAGGVYAKNLEVVRLRHNIRSPRLPQFKAVVYSRSRVGSRVKLHPAIVGEWYR